MAACFICSLRVCEVEWGYDVARTRRKSGDASNPGRAINASMRPTADSRPSQHHYHHYQNVHPRCRNPVPLAAGCRGCRCPHRYLLQQASRRSAGRRAASSAAAMTTPPGAEAAAAGVGAGEGRRWSVEGWPSGAAGRLRPPSPTGLVLLLPSRGVSCCGMGYTCCACV